MVRDDPAHRISDLQRLATILLPQPRGADPMWQNEARDLFLGLALYVLDDPAQASTIGQIYRLLKSDLDLADVIDAVLKSDALDATARQSLASFLNKAPKERSGVRSNLTATLNLWANPVIDAATAASDFELTKLRRRPTSIYVSVKQNQLRTLAPLLGLFFQQCVDILGRDLPGTDEPHQVLLLIDEFASLGTLPVLVDAMAFLAAYGVRLVLIIQGLSQLDHLYRSARDSILQNAGVQVYFAANDDATARYVANRLGTKTIRTASRSEPGGFGWATKTTGYARRELMLPEEVRQFRATQEIIFKEGARPVKAGKLRYYKDRQLKARLLPPVPVPAMPIALPVAPPVAVRAMQTRADDGDLSRARSGGATPDNKLTSEVEAMGQNIAALMAGEADPSTQVARDELLEALSAPPESER